MPEHASITSTDWVGLPRRLAVAGFVVATALCSGLAFVAVCRGDPGCLGLAAFAGVVALALRAYLRSRVVELESAWATEDDEGEIFFEKEGEALHAEELAELLRSWSELERARGTLRFDAWAWQSARAEIRRRLEDDAGLRRRLGLSD